MKLMHLQISIDGIHTYIHTYIQLQYWKLRYIDRHKSLPMRCARAAVMWSIYSKCTCLTIIECMYTLSQTAVSGMVNVAYSEHDSDP